jgi:hypothetical protein
VITETLSIGKPESLSSPSANSTSLRFGKTPTALLCCPKAIYSPPSREITLFTTPKMRFLSVLMITFLPNLYYILHQPREINFISITRVVTIKSSCTSYKFLIYKFT